ncbi:MAG: methionine--tRNA ligase subunit beta [Candidatus Omnitrophota bacterium]
MERVSFEDFRKLDLRIAEVLEAKEHENADKLYVLQIDVGGEKKQIIAGVRGYYQAHELVGRKIIVVNNLEPVTLRGEESNGMLLAAGTEDGPVLLMPEKNVPSGSQIS